MRIPPTDTADDFQLDNYLPQSPPDHERGQPPARYTPPSPVYTVPDNWSDKAECGSPPDLETVEDDMPPMSPKQDKMQQTEDQPQMIAPADKNADLDNIQDSTRKDSLKKKLGPELEAAPWTRNPTKEAL